MGIVWRRISKLYLSSGGCYDPVKTRDMSKERDSGTQPHVPIIDEANKPKETWDWAAQ